MILTVSLDPKLTRVISLDNLNKGSRHLSKRTKIIGENGGMDVSKIVSDFNEKTFCIGFVGGRNGEQSLNYLDNNLINHEFIIIGNETRGNISIITEDGIETGIEEISPRVNGSELERFYRLYRELIVSADIVCLSGDSPRGIQKDIYGDLISLAREENKMVIAALSDEYLSNSLKNGASLLNIKLEDLEEITGLIIREDKDIIRLGHNLLQNDIELLAIYKGEGNYIILNKEKAYISSLKDSYILLEDGCREAFLAGYAVSEKRKYELDYKLRVAIACHIAKGLEYEAGLFDMTKMKTIMNEISIETIDI